MAAAMVAAGEFLAGLAIPTDDVNQFSLRQAGTPLRLQGRVNATMRTLIRGTLPLGALDGGVLAIWFSPVRTLLVPPRRLDK